MILAYTTPPSIFEDRYWQDWKGEKGDKIRASINGLKNKDGQKLTTTEQVNRGSYYFTCYSNRKAEIEGEYLPEWNKLENVYASQSPVLQEDEPDIYIPLINPIIEGQIAAMVDKNMTVNVKGASPGDQLFARKGQIAADFILDKNNIKSHVKDGGRNYLLKGNCVFGFAWDADALSGTGLPEWKTIEPSKVFVDGRIKDIKDYQKAEYIIHEIGNVNLLYARNEYGDDVASCLSAIFGETQYDTAELTQDDMRGSFTLLHVWTRNNKEGNLQLIEMDSRGLILRYSDPSKPYYAKVHNQYPFYFAGEYPMAERFYRFGDGRLLYPVQDTVTKLYKEILTAVKYSSQATTYVDPNAEADTDTWSNDPSEPRIVNNPTQNIKDVAGRGINAVVFQLLQDLFRQAERIARFSNLMTGVNPGETMTATQVGVQTQQGNAGINDKRYDMSMAVAYGIKYCINLGLEYWDKGFWVRMGDNEDGYEYVDFEEFRNVPMLMPASMDYLKQHRENNPDVEPPKYMQYEPDEDIKDDDGNVLIKKGEGQTKDVEFDVKVSIGEGLPTGKLAMYNIILSLSQLQVFDEQTGKPKPILSYRSVKKMIEDLLGLPLDETFKDMQKQGMMLTSAQPQQQIPQGGGAAPTNMPNVQQVTNDPTNGIDGNILGQMARAEALG